MLIRLSSLPPETVSALSLKLTHQLIKFFSSFPELQSQIGASYLPLKSEVAPVYQELFKEVQVSLAFPVLVDDQMLFGIPEGMPIGTTWLKEPYQLAEPEWLLVPGVGFDLSGARLGRGKGFYDRYLEGKDVCKIGLAWSEQIVEKVPVEKHDSHMDFIITEEFCWDVNQQEKF